MLWKQISLLKDQKPPNTKTYMPNIWAWTYHTEESLDREYIPTTQIFQGTALPVSFSTF